MGTLYLPRSREVITQSGDARKICGRAGVVGVSEQRVICYPPRAGSCTPQASEGRAS